MSPAAQRAPGFLRRIPRAFSTFFATSLAARTVGIGCQLLQVPLVVHALGSEAFGLWMAMTSVTNLVLFADFGLGLGAQNQLAEQLARHETADARALFARVFVFLSLVGAGLAVALGVVVTHIDFAAWFHLHDATTRAAAPRAALVLGLMFCAGFPLGLAQRLAFARQEGWRYNVAQSAASAASLGGVAVVTRVHGGLVALVAAAQGALLLANAGLLLVQLRQLRWLDRKKFRWRLAPARGLLHLGACFGVQQVLTTVLFSLPQVVISTTLGAAAVTPYNLVQRLFNLFAVVQNAFMLPLWPAYSRAKARGEFGWMHRALRFSLYATAGCSVAPMALGACFAPAVIHLWVGGATPAPDPLLVWLLWAWNALVFFQQPYSYLLAGVSEVRRTTLYSVLSALTSSAAMAALARPLGAPGVILGLLAGYVPFNFIGSIVEARRYLRAAPLPVPSVPVMATP